MKTKIPPPIIALVMIAIIYLSSLIIEPITFGYQTVISILVVVIGCHVPYLLFGCLQNIKQPLVLLLLQKLLHS